MVFGVNCTAIVGEPVYLEWARFSAQTVKEFMPRVRFSVYTNKVKDAKRCEYIDDVLPAPGYPTLDLQGAMIDGILASWELGYDVTLFTGADTVFCGDVSDVMELMSIGKFDLALTLPADQRRRRYPLRGVHPGFPYYRDGILIFSRNSVVRRFLEDWQTLYCSHRDECGGFRKEGACMHPTIPAMNEALYWHNNLRLILLPNNYCCTFWTGCLYGIAKIMHVHGAGGKKGQKMAGRLNENPNAPRLYRNRKLLGRD